MIVGHKYRPVVTVLKIKKGVPTVIRVSGREYVFFTRDEIVAAYMDKNRVNHDRQENGY